MTTTADFGPAKQFEVGPLLHFDGCEGGEWACKIMVIAKNNKVDVDTPPPALTYTVAGGSAASAEWTKIKQIETTNKFAKDRPNVSRPPHHPLP